MIWNTHNSVEYQNAKTLWFALNFVCSGLVLIKYSSISSILFCNKRSTHWSKVMHICVNKVTIIGSDNGLSPCRRQAIIWTKAGILLIEPLGTISSGILIETHIFAFKKIRLEMSSRKCRPFCLALNVLTITTCNATAINNAYTIFPNFLWHASKRISHLKHKHQYVYHIQYIGWWEKWLSFHLKALLWLKLPQQVTEHCHKKYDDMATLNALLDVFFDVSLTSC